MRESELNALTVWGRWQYLGRGSYNLAYKSEANWSQLLRLNSSTNPPSQCLPVVLKLPHVIGNVVDRDLCAPARIARKWALINPDLPICELKGYRILLGRNAPPPLDQIKQNCIYVYDCIGTDKIRAIYRHSDNQLKDISLTDIPEAEKQLILQTLRQGYRYLTIELENELFKQLNLPRQGLIVPFITGEEPTDEQLSLKVIDIYLKTRTIIADACYPHNFFYDKQTGESTCIDFDQAFHRASPASQIFGCGNPYETFIQNYDTNAADFQKTIRVITALFYLEKFLSEGQILDAYITPQILEKIYVESEYGSPLTEERLLILKQEVDLKNTPNNGAKDRSALLAYSTFRPIQEALQEAFSDDNVLSGNEERKQSTYFTG